MSGLAETKAASIIGPVACTEAQALAIKYGKGLRGQYNYASGVASANDALPTQTVNGKLVVPLVKRFVRVFNRHPTAILDFGFGIGTAPTLVYAQLSAFGTGHVAAGGPVGPMSYQDFIVPDGSTHCAWILDPTASPATSIVTIWCAEDNVN
jgi:hypothetical protein